MVSGRAKRLFSFLCGIVDSCHFLGGSCRHRSYHKPRLASSYMETTEQSGLAAPSLTLGPLGEVGIWTSLVRWGLVDVYCAGEKQTFKQIGMDVCVYALRRLERWRGNI